MPRVFAGCSTRLEQINSAHLCLERPRHALSLLPRALPRYTSARLKSVSPLALQPLAGQQDHDVPIGGMGIATAPTAEVHQQPPAPLDRVLDDGASLR